MRVRASALLLLALVPGAVARPRRDHAVSPPAAMDAAVQEAAARAAADAARERALADARVAAAARLQAVEGEAGAAAAQLDALARRRAELQASLAARGAAMAPLLPLAERMQLYPAEALLAANASPDAAVHGLLVLRGMARELEREAAAIRREQAEVDRLTGAIAAALPRLRTAQAAQAAQATALDQALATARNTRQSGDAALEAAQRNAEQAAQAATVRAALERIAAAQAQEVARARAAAAVAVKRREPVAAATALREEATLAQPAGPGLVRGVVPVAGQVVRRWGEATEAGPEGGMVYRAAPDARVVAPCAGRVAFAGPFRSFGLLLIVDCGGGYHFVMAGMARLDAQVGRAVRAGEPIGVMPGWDPQVPGERPGLYVELRHGGERVDPGPFLSTKG